MPSTSSSEFHLHNSFTFWLHRLANVMREEFNTALRNEDVTWPQWMAMNVLHHGLADTPAAIASNVGVDRSAITRSLDRLENKGLVQRSHDCADRRSVAIGLTKAGKQMMGRLNHLACEHQLSFLKELPATEHRVLKGHIQKMLKAAAIDTSEVWRHV